MDEVELCDKLMQVTYYVEVSYQGELINAGSGTCYRPDGWLLTAAHVIDTKLHDNARPKPDFTSDTQLRVRARLQNGPFALYVPVTVGLEFQILAFKYPLIIDLAILRPLSVDAGMPFLPLRGMPAPAGTHVLLAGFPDEIRPPLDFDLKLDKQHPEVAEQQETLRVLSNLVFMKHGMIGRVFNLSGADPQRNVQIMGNEYYVDQSSHSGASGGPVVDMDGNLVGIICQRTTTDVSTRDYADLRVPSGSTRVLSPSLLENRRS